MALAAQFAGDLQIQGTLYVSGFVPPAASITDAALGNISWLVRAGFAEESSTTSATQRRVLAVVKGTNGTLKSFKAGAVVANVGAATIVVDLLKNGVSILSATLTLDNTVVAYALLTGTFSSTALVAGDVLEYKITSTAGGGTLGKGSFGELVFSETAI